MALSPRIPAAMAALLLAVPGWAAPLWQEASGSGGKARADKAGTLPDFTRMARQATEAVVSISTTQDADPAEDPVKSLLEPSSSEPQKGLGSGFFIHPDGYLITNAHVIEGATDIVVSVRREGRVREYRAHLIGVDTPTDAALLKVDAEGEQFPTLALGNSDELQVAEWIAAIGNPYGLSYSVTVGVVSYKGRNDVMPAGRDGYYDYIQTDASINPGNSGGPVLNTAGDVVAVANAVNAVGQGIGFAIPINMIKSVLIPLLKDGAVRRSWIGISVQDLTPEVVRTSGLPNSARGVLVTDVMKGSPGEQAGLETGDLVLAFDGERVDEAQKLRWLAATGGVGKQVTLTVERSGKVETRSTRLAPLPESEPAAIPQPTEVGMLVAEVDVPTARSAGLALPLGARVREVKTGSAADRAGIKQGDVILKVDDLEIHTPAVLAKALNKVDSGDFAHVVARRDASTMFLSMKKP